MLHTVCCAVQIRNGYKFSKAYQNSGTICRYITLYLYNISPYHKRKE